ncbi:hypothetical protein JOD82_002139 [Paenibacillus sp. 1182]|uniref:hypothetical protein n=1 Tax=Paenibacillus sp. 1182 TaxID=2806565 RepID=UPI001B6D7173|nr:hypothetical protein [Paenibacillus sp. 1182]MBP1309119.1 hypothetical protein [Paenibacillus sp. 1182]
MGNWDSYDGLDYCNCGASMPYGAGFCSDTCYLASLNEEQRVKERLRRNLKQAQKDQIREAQKIRIMDRVLSHNSSYKLPGDVVRFYFTNNIGRDFLGLYQKGKRFCFGRVAYFNSSQGVSNCDHYENPLAFESFLCGKGYKCEHKIWDDQGNEVSYFDFEQLIFRSLWDDEQNVVAHNIPVYNGHMQLYRYAGGL